MNAENLPDLQKNDADLKTGGEEAAFLALSASLPREGAVTLTVVDGMIVFRASADVQDRIEELLEKQQHAGLSDSEARELDQYEELDDFLSLQNRLTRNYLLTQQDSRSAT